MANLVSPTLGGTQFWRDTYIHAGWRIQQNVFTRHCRLLDTESKRRAWGSYNAVYARFSDIRKAQAIEPVSRTMVMLVHGIAPVIDPFRKTEPFLRDLGYDVVSVRYPSTRDTLQSHAAGLAQVLERLEGTDVVHFVTHSMGGLVIRCLLAGEGAWRDRVKVGRVILIAPPNQGSAIARVLQDFQPYKFFWGKSGQQLTPKAAANVPQARFPFITIAGGRNDGRGYNPLLDGDNDGTVTVAETLLAGAEAHHVVPSIHTTIAGSPDALRLCRDYLASYTDAGAPSDGAYRPSGICSG